MKQRRLAFACLPLLAGCGTFAVPRVMLRPAEPYHLPGALTRQGNEETDCNNPAHWDGETMCVFASFGHPFRSSGPDLFRLSRPTERTEFDNAADWQGGCRWIEATYKAADGRLYGWYHNEPNEMCGRKGWTAPRIGAVVSTDNGFTWNDLGLVLTAPPDSLHCASMNYFFCGGNGDFCVNLDRDQRFFYFFVSTYHKDVAEQGVAVARMAYADRDAPVGKVLKWHRGKWSEPGLGGHVTPIYPVRADWHRADADAFWGPSVHWNTHLGQWVMLLNRAKDNHWNQEGVYIAFNTDLGRPEGWTKPERILEGDMTDVHWYPQVIGTNAAAKETDKLAGRTARLFVKGVSKWEIVFVRPGERE